MMGKFVVTAFYKAAGTKPQNFNKDTLDEAIGVLNKLRLDRHIHKLTISVIIFETHVSVHTPQVLK